MIGDTGGVALDNLGIAELASGAGALCADQSEAGEGDGEKGGIHVVVGFNVAGGEVDADWRSQHID